MFCGAEKPHETSGVGCFEPHGFPSAGMVEVEAEGMEGKAMKRILARSILLVSGNGIAQVAHVDAYLVLAPRLEPHLGQRVAAVGGDAPIVCDGLFAAIVGGAAIGDVGLVVLEPGVHRAALLLHLATEHSHIAAVIDDVVPVGFEHPANLQVLGVDHQAAGVAVETVHHMGCAVEMATLEILVENGLDAVLPRGRGHAEDALGLLDDDEVLVLVDDFHILVQELGAALVAADEYRLPGAEHEVVLGDELPVDHDAVPLQEVLDAVAADTAHFLHQELHERHCLLHGQLYVFAGSVLCAG